MPLRVLREQDLLGLLTPGLAFQACERAFRAIHQHAWHPAEFQGTDVGGGRLVSSVGFDDQGTVIRFETAAPRRAPHGAPHPSPLPSGEREGLGYRESLGGRVSIYRPAAELRCTLPYGPVVTVRASAVAALATKHLANEAAPKLGIIGTGEQAKLHVKAMLRVRNIKRVISAGRTEKKTQAFTAALANELGGGMIFEAADIGRTAYLADILCVCTDSRTPVLFGNEVAKGCHVNATGATTFDAREVDANMVLRSKVVIEDKEMGISRSGDLRIPAEEGKVRAEQFQTDLGDLVMGKKVVRTSEDDITFFTAVGHPAVDFYLALAAFEAAVEKRVGAEVES